MRVWESEKIIISFEDGYWYVLYKHSGNKYKRLSGTTLIMSNLRKGLGLWKS